MVIARPDIPILFNAIFASPWPYLERPERENEFREIAVDITAEFLNDKKNLY